MTLHLLRPFVSSYAHSSCSVARPASSMYPSITSARAISGASTESSSVSARRSRTSATRRVRNSSRSCCSSTMVLARHRAGKDKQWHEIVYATRDETNTLAKQKRQAKCISWTDRRSPAMQLLPLYRHNNPHALQLIEMVRAPRHHPHALAPVLAARVAATTLAAHLDRREAGNNCPLAPRRHAGVCQLRMQAALGPAEIALICVQGTRAHEARPAYVIPSAREEDHYANRCRPCRATGRSGARCRGCRHRA